jgi:TRAP-type C4-dicarboxylate transport system permease small subunit
VPVRLLHQIKKYLSRLDRAGRWAEDGVLVIVLIAMILLAASQIVMRNFLNIGLIWGDEMLRMLVLWIAVAGAVAASRSDKHINIAVLDRYLPAKLKLAVKVFIHLFTAGICGVVAWYSAQFVMTSWEFGDVLMGSVPAWILQLIMPVGFGLICYRYSLFSIRELLLLFRARRSA